MRNIVLLGGSNSVMTDGLQKGLREYANVTNLALGGTTSLQNLYELKRKKNQEAIWNADLILTESVINELDNHNIRENLPLSIIFKNLQYFYGTLYALQKWVCILMLPYRARDYLQVMNMHRFLANHYGLSCIDMQHYYQEHEMVAFGNTFGGHQLAVVSCCVGRAIAKHIDAFRIPYKHLDIHLPEFKVLTPESMERHGGFKIFNPHNAMYNEITYRLERGNHLSFRGYEGYQILGIHSWNLEDNGEISRLPWGIATAHCACVHLKSHTNIIKPTSKLNIFCEIHAEPIITEDLIGKFNDENLEITEFYVNSHLEKPNKILLSYFDVIGFFLCKPNPKMQVFPLDVIPDDRDVELEKEVDCSYLLPNLVFFRDSMEFLEGYIGRLYPNVTKHIDSTLTPQILKQVQGEVSVQIQSAIAQLKQSLESQTQVLQETLAQKDSKIKDLTHQHSAQEIHIKALEEHLRNKEASLRALEEQYYKALNLQNHLSYKLGNALITAHKNWYKGGYIRLIFEALKIKKHFRTTQKSHKRKNALQASTTAFKKF